MTEEKPLPRVRACEKNFLLEPLVACISGRAQFGCSFCHFCSQNAQDNSYQRCYLATVSYYVCFKKHWPLISPMETGIINSLQFVLAIIVAQTYRRLKPVNASSFNQSEPTFVIETMKCFKLHNFLELLNATIAQVRGLAQFHDVIRKLFPVSTVLFQGNGTRNTNVRIV